MTQHYLTLTRRYLALLAIVSLWQVSCLQAQPKYDTSQTKEVIEKMVAAHGGLNTWRNAPTISYDNIFFNPFSTEGEDAYPWWVSSEVINQKTRQVYQDWPLDDGQIVYDGKEVWSKNWGNDNTPRFMALLFYYFVDLPWLTQDANVHLGTMETGQLPGFDKNYITVMMTFTEKPAAGKTIQDSYKLFIDPDTYLLQGYEYWIGFGPMLDLMGVPEGQIFGPMLRVHDKFTTVDGLVFPTRFHTMPPDGSTTYGFHIVINYSLTKPFDKNRLKKPDDAVIDKSTYLRKSEK